MISRRIFIYLDDPSWSLLVSGSSVSIVRCLFLVPRVIFNTWSTARSEPLCATSSRSHPQTPKPSSWPANRLDRRNRNPPYYRRVHACRRWFYPEDDCHAWPSGLGKSTNRVGCQAYLPSDPRSLGRTITLVGITYPYPAVAWPLVVMKTWVAFVVGPTLAVLSIYNLL